MSSARGPREEKAPRVYVGNLPNDIKQGEVEDLFQRFGRIVSCDIKRTISGAPFAFVEFEDVRDSEDAIKARDGYNLDGCRLRVEVPFSVKGNYRKRQAGPPRRGQYRLLISGLPQSGSWQDVKDHLREAGECVYADVFRDGTGIVEYNDREDMDYAVRNFDGSKFRSHEGEVSRISIRVAGSVDRLPRSMSPSYDRRGGGGGGGGYRVEGGRGSSRDRDRDPRGNGSYRRRSRSRSRSR